MKKFFAMFCLLLACSACSDKDDSASAPTVKLSSEDPSVMVILNGQSALVSLTNEIETSKAVIHFESSVEISLKSDSEWCGATLSGGVITIEALHTDSDRRAVISLMSQGTELGRLIVNQLTTPAIEVELTALEAPSDGMTRTLDVSTNQPVWGATSDAEWITADAARGELTLTVATNTSAERTGIVTLYAGSGSSRTTATVTVSQASNSMILEYTLSDPESTVLLPLSGAANIQINWGDGTKEDYNLTISSSAPIRHTYTLAGVYNVSVLGTAAEISHGGLAHTVTSRSYLTAIKAWGNLEVTSMENAFYTCTNLASIPENTHNSFKNVTTFKYAFWKSGLQAIPASLFNGCDKLTLATYCFSDCKITEIPETLLAGAPNITDFNTCFSSNTKLTKIPAKLFANSSKASNMSACFQLCSSLTEIPAGLFKNVSAPKMNDMFYGCKALTAVPDELFAGCSSTTTLSGCFQNCTALVSVGNDVFKGCTQVTTYGNLFFGCTSLESVPANIFDDSKKVTTFSGVFRNNTKLVTESPYTMVDGVKVHLYERSLHPSTFTKPTTFGGCFYNCTSLADWSVISASFVAWTK